MQLTLNKHRTLLVLAACAAAGLVVWRQAAGLNAGEPYKTQTIEKGPLTQNISANGTLNPVILVNVGSQVSGTVKRLHVDFNDRVTGGQALADLDDALLSAQARLSAAGLQSALVSLDLANANEARSRSLFAKNYASRQELDQVVQAKRAATAAVDLARAQADKDRVTLSYTVIRSPVSGVVVARSVDVGQTVAASFQTPTLFQIAQDLSAMQIDTSFPEADIGNVKVGMDARFTVDAFPGRAFNGKVRQIRLNPATQQNVVTYNVVVAVDNPDQALMPGMTAYVNIGIAQRAEALLVPNAALRFKPAGTPAPSGKAGADGKSAKSKKDSSSGTVYLLQAGDFKPLAVTLGITDNKNTEIVAGDLKAGDTVIVGEAAAASSPGAAKTVGMRMF
ncbi:MAG: efflux transporter periplasmic adaptor subunit [Gammaproteobacteria bacterium RIFOXYA12_FULL_61_12]|nr:MAG: efflux transporter periplasmic adaptor subunit [Gammaproteobacteria bacterium RIFOXYD12_FULL_61_37]OGT94114.1 MAG: efflux transporter periplasmic adaptor subunit [Gammaproteobacteria bacterium RIFOXYA12_FULL_61_12]